MRKAKHAARPVKYRLAPDLAVEDFDDKAIVFLASQEHLITVNRSAAVVIKIMRREFGKRGFSDRRLAGLILRGYHLDAVHALKEARNIIQEWCKLKILVSADGQPRTRGRA